jgi:hypothetical protein
LRFIENWRVTVPSENFWKIQLLTPAEFYLGIWLHGDCALHRKKFQISPKVCDIRQFVKKLCAGNTFAEDDKSLHDNLSPEKSVFVQKEASISISGMPARDITRLISDYLVSA